MTNPGYRTYRPTSIKIVIKKSDKDKFKDMENFVKKIGLCIFPDYPKEYPPIPEQWLIHEKTYKEILFHVICILYGEGPR